MSEVNMDLLLNSAQQMETHFKAFKEINSVIQMISSSINLNRELERRKQDLMGDIERLSKEIDSLKTKLEDGKKAADASLAEMSAELHQALAAKKASANVELEELKLEIQATRGNLEAARAEMNKFLDDTSAAKTAIRKEIEEKKDILDKIKAELKAIRAKVS